MKKLKVGFIFSVVLIPFIAYLLVFLVTPVANILVKFLSNSACNFQYGGGSRSLCNWEVFNVAWAGAFVLSTILILLSRKLVHKIGVVKDYSIGILYLVLILPINILLYESVIKLTNLPMGNSRGDFNNVFTPILFLLNLIVFLLLSYRK